MTDVFSAELFNQLRESRWIGKCLDKLRSFTLQQKGARLEDARSEAWMNRLTLLRGRLQAFVDSSRDCGDEELLRHIGIARDVVRRCDEIVAFLSEQKCARDWQATHLVSRDE